MNLSPNPDAVSQLSDERPGDLLAWVAEGDEAERTAAMLVLLNRYTRWLFGVVRKPALPYGGETLAEDLVEQTFRKVFRAAGKFRQVSGQSDEVHEKRFKKWLLRIADRLLKDWIRKNDWCVTRDDLFWEQVSVDSDGDGATLPDERTQAAIDEAWSELSEREQEIYRAYLCHCTDLQNPQAKLPRTVIRELCERFNTTEENIRAIRSRTKKKIRERLESKGISR